MELSMDSSPMEPESTAPRRTPPPRAAVSGPSPCAAPPRAPGFEGRPRRSADADRGAETVGKPGETVGKSWENDKHGEKRGFMGMDPSFLVWEMDF